MGAARSNQVTIAGTTAQLQIVQGRRSWKTESIPYDPATKRPFYEYVPFGFAGMGASVLHNRGRDQHHYSIDFDVDHWNRTADRLQLGLERNTIDISGVGTINSITKISEIARDSSGNMYVYLCTASAFLPKIRLDTMALIGSTKQFSHGSNHIITDLLVVKDGSDILTTGSPRALSQVGNGVLLAAFGPTATLAQADSVTSNATDTWVTAVSGGGAGTAYGGVLAKMKGTSPGETWLWKSSGVSGSGYVNGAFSRLMYLATSTSSSIFYTDHNSWLPATPYQVGDFGSNINGLTEFNRGLVVGKPEGIYAFDSNFNDAPLATFRGKVSDINGRHLSAWGNTLVYPTVRDMHSLGGPIGLTRLVSNTSPVQGKPTAHAVWEDRLFVAVTDGTDTYVLMLKPREGESIENPYVIWPVTKIASTTSCYAMKVVTDASGVTKLLIAEGTNLHWMILDPIASRKYKSTGEYYSARFQPPARFVMESYSFRVKTAGANVNITPSYELDDSGSFTAGTVVTSSGYKTQNITAVNTGADVGNSVRIKFAGSTNSNTTTPVIIGGGVFVRGNYVGESYEEIVFVIHAGTWSASGVGTDGSTTYNTLKGYQGTNQEVVYADFFGDSSARVMHIISVEETEGVGDTPQASERFIEVRMRRLAGTA